MTPIGGRPLMGRAGRGVFEVDQDAAVARAGTDVGRRRLPRFQRGRRRVVGDQQRRGGAHRRHLGRAGHQDQSPLAGDVLMNDVNALASASAGGLTCRVCGMPDPPPDPTCHQGMDHRVGRAARCPHCGRLPQACAWRPCFGSLHDADSGLVRRMWQAVTRPAAGRADP